MSINYAPDELAPLQQYTAAVGKAPAIVLTFQQFSEPLFYSNQLSNTAAIGATPMISWDPSVHGVGIPLVQITAGNYDTYIKSSAAAAKGWGHPMYIRLGHEMNLSGSLFGPGQEGNTPADFVAAWRHVVTIFRQAGATNVRWVWSPNVDCAGHCPFTAFYPGDAWVDWVALDGYDYGPVDNIPPMSFDQIFAHSYAVLTAMTTKPVMIAETATSAKGAARALWIANAFKDIASKFPRIRALMWWDRVKSIDWRVEASPESLAMWRSIVSSPANGGTAATMALVASLPASTSTAGSKSTAGGPATASRALDKRHRRARRHRHHHRHDRHRHHRHHRHHAN